MLLRAELRIEAPACAGPGHKGDTTMGASWRLHLEKLPRQRRKIIIPIGGG